MVVATSKVFYVVYDIKLLYQLVYGVQGQNFTFLEITRTFGCFSCGSKVGVDSWMLWWLSDTVYFVLNL